MKIIGRLHRRYGKRFIWSVAGAALVIIIIIVVAIKSSENTASIATNVPPTVVVSSVRDISGKNTINLIGSVEAVDEVRLETEASGRITSVGVGLGDSVAAGQIIAQIENASEYAALLQAQGSYEAAVASSRSTSVSLINAQSDAINTYRSSYSKTNDVILNTIDSLFSNPKAITPGVRIQTGSNVDILNSERYAFNTMLSEWQKQSVTLTTSSDLHAALREARANVTRVQKMIDIFIPYLASEDAGTFTETQLSTIRSNFASSDTVITSLLNSINSAEDTLSRAELSSSGGVVSAADAQVKQALGSLKAAEANYAKTVIRTSIAGTVNSLSVKTGDYVSTFAPVAIVANNNALEITTYVGASDRDRIAVGQKVIIAKKYTGVVTQVAPAVDPVTKKVEVKIQAETADISNGDTVDISITTTNETAVTVGPILVPITAVKFNAENGDVFSVVEGQLVSHPVVIGDVRGAFVEILDGITFDDTIVLDARGLNAGERVEAILP
ncbi:HlyD family efflux transporter periplasmic adaptor subunit [Candidatus Parcubacteria bacterium]|uniref:Membrane fusion protein biotin-lipoyl like domain-containing protein n=1 Tax=Candidatus Kaiserbacteria bacterium CG10_big_fil_rev_8_21_14_0_10_47_16 TaxID=1974608 RepID=A0A2H0UET8_9BACT|nr:HlyD family efflux transporter periplasmic adaptor subunit [Candidatus Parcubacteria bacterium]PIR84285.1 MAG: hypothetical protein COU16_01670 [Candidatus Kaiserbacteria bacterium CG10_big_fil_rev_8_21_14_0_10_47_16]